MSWLESPGSGWQSTWCCSSPLTSFHFQWRLWGVTQNDGRSRASQTHMDRSHVSRDKKKHSPRGSNPQSLDPKAEIEVQRVTITPGEHVYCSHITIYIAGLHPKVDESVTCPFIPKYHLFQSAWWAFFFQPTCTELSNTSMMNPATNDGAIISEGI